MAIIASLGISMFARTSKFQKSVRRAERSLNQFARRVARVGRRVAAFSTVAVGAAVAGLTVLVKKNLAAIDSVGKLSDRIGISTENLIGLRRAAEITGASTETLDKGLEKFAKNLGDAAAGIGTAKPFLEDLGLTAEELINLDLGDAFRIVAGRISQLGTQSQKAAAAQALFGRAGLQLVNTLDLGSDGLLQMQKRAEELGEVFSRVDAAQVEMANDSIRDLTAAIGAAGTQLTIALAPFIKLAADELTNFAVNGVKQIGNFGSGFSKLTELIGGAADSIDALKGSFETLEGVGFRALEKLSEGISFLGENVVQTAGKGIQNLGDILKNNLGANNEEALERLDKAGKLLERSGATVAKVYGDAAEEAGNRANKAFGQANKTFEGIKVGKNQLAVQQFFDNLAKQNDKIRKQQQADIQRRKQQQEARRKQIAGLKNIQSFMAKTETFAKGILQKAGAPLLEFLGIGTPGEKRKAALPQAPGADPISALERVGEFRQVNLGRVFLEGVEKAKKTEQVVKDPQGLNEAKKQTGLLTQMAEGIRFLGTTKGAFTIP